MVALYEGRTDDGFRYHQEMLRLARLEPAAYEAGMALLGWRSRARTEETHEQG